MSFFGPGGLFFKSVFNAQVPQLMMFIQLMRFGKVEAVMLLHTLGVCSSL